MRHGRHGSVRTGFRVVLDTNVYISAFRYPKGVPARIFEAGILRLYQRIVSPAIIEEYARISRGEKFQTAEEKIERDKKAITHSAELVQPDSVPNVIPDNEGDNNILACAIAGKADFIVTGDKDLLRLKNYEGIAIVRSVDLLRTLGLEE